MVTGSLISRFKHPNTLKGEYLASLRVDVGQSVFPPMLIEGLLLLTMQGLRVVILINTVLQNSYKK